MSDNQNDPYRDEHGRPIAKGSQRGKAITRRLAEEAAAAKSKGATAQPPLSGKEALDSVMGRRRSQVTKSEHVSPSEPAKPCEAPDKAAQASAAPSSSPDISADFLASFFTTTNSNQGAQEQPAAGANSAGEPLSAMGQAAVAYARLGVPVFPLNPKSKRPLIRGGHGHKDATTDVAQIAALWTKHPRAMIGVPMGAASGIICIDADAKLDRPGLKNLADFAAGRPLGATASELSPSGGAHFFFVCDSAVPSSNDKVAPGIEVKTDGTYVAVAPSVRADGKAYAAHKGKELIRHGRNLAPMPDFLRDWITAATGERASTEDGKKRKLGDAALLAPDLDELAKAIGFIPDEKLNYDDWVNVFRAIKFACAGDEEFYDSIVLPWCRKHPRTNDATTRGRWDSFYDSEIGARYVFDRAIAHGYVPPIDPAALGDEPAPEQETGEEPKKESGRNIVRGSDDALTVDFTNEHAARLRYVSESDKWIHYDGKRWREIGAPAVWNMVRPVVRSYAKKWARGEPRTQPATLRALTSRSTIVGVENLARGADGIRTSIEDWDTDGWALGTPEGIIDLRTGKRHADGANFYCTKATAVIPAEPGTKHPLWSAFLAKVTRGDSELQDYLQRAAGYSLSGLVIEHAFFFLYGTGSNGKGVFISTLSGMLGEYAVVAPPNMLTESKFEQHPTDVAHLRGARFVQGQETKKGQHWDEPKLKRMTGGDTVTARLMRKNFRDYVPRFKLWFASNDVPSLHHVDVAIMRRLHLIPFAQTIVASERDPTLAEKLKAEWPAILRWAIDGCLAWQKRGLTMPRAVTAATNHYFANQDPTVGWLKARCVESPLGVASFASLFADYKAYCARRNVTSVYGRNSFARWLMQQGFTVRRGTSKHSEQSYGGLALKLVPDDAPIDDVNPAAIFDDDEDDKDKP